MTTRKRILVLGSTGSIGVQTLDVARMHDDLFEIVGIAAGRRAKELLGQAHEFPSALVAIGCEDISLSPLDNEFHELADCFVGYGEDAVLRLIDECNPDIVVNALVGARGVRASYNTLNAGIDLALANKESLVVAGDILMPLALSADSGYATYATGGMFVPSGRLRPIDSEHGAIFQCLLGEDMSDLDRLWITASGGPFRGCTPDELNNVTAKDALAHPTWNMGPKITIDSSTLMNKGLEVIEAHHLFGVPYDKIDVVVHPQSIVHSMVEMADGSVKAHLGTTDMRIPIQFALTYPARLESPVKHMDFKTCGSLTFDSPDTNAFRCLELAYDAGRAGGTLPCAMNAANEVAVDAFLNGKCKYLDIASTIETVMEAHIVEPAISIEQMFGVDNWARSLARHTLASI